MLSWSTRLEQALEDGSFELHAQAVLPLRAGAAALGWEVLLRLRDQGRQLCMPGGFLPPAERFHLMARIDLWVVKAVIAGLEAPASPWRSDGRVSINLSAQSIADAGFRSALMDLLAAAPQVSARVCFELAEASVLADSEGARTLAVMLRGCGAWVAIDDFGAATAALSWLRDFPVDLLKVDRQLCAGLPGTALDQVVLRACVEVAAVLGVPAVAKGLETEAQLQAARGLGFAHGQGFLLAAPQALAAPPALGDNPPTGIALPTA